MQKRKLGKSNLELSAIGFLTGNDQSTAFDQRTGNNYLQALTPATSR